MMKAVKYTSLNNSSRLTVFPAILIYSIKLVVRGNQ